MEKKSILVIDDDRDVLDLVSAILEKAGYGVELVGTEDEILGRLTSGAHYDLIVTDVWMPWMSGIQVVRFAHEAGHTTPVLFMSGFADPALEKRVHVFGEHVRLLRKPFEGDTLLDAVDESLHPERIVSEETPRAPRAHRRARARRKRSAA